MRARFPRRAVAPRLNARRATGCRTRAHECEADDAQEAEHEHRAEDAEHDDQLILVDVDRKGTHGDQNREADRRSCSCSEDGRSQNVPEDSPHEQSDDDDAHVHDDDDDGQAREGADHTLRNSPSCGEHHAVRHQRIEEEKGCDDEGMPDQRKYEPDQPRPVLEARLTGNAERDDAEHEPDRGNQEAQDETGDAQRLASPRRTLNALRLVRLT